MLFQFHYNQVYNLSLTLSPTPLYFHNYGKLTINENILLPIEN